MASSGMGTSGTKSIVVDFKLLSSDAVRNIQELNTKIANLKKTMEGMKQAGLENSEQYIKMSAVLKDLQSSVKANQKILQEDLKQMQANGDSINALRAQLKLARAEFENLTKAERESAEGNDLLNHIKELTEELNGLEQAQGDWSRQVGHYQKAVEDLPVTKAVNFFKTLSNGTMNAGVAFKNGIGIVKNFGKQLWALMKIPIVAVISAIVLVVMKLVDAFKRNDVAMTALHRVFAAFEPILAAINKLFDSLVNVLAKAVNGIANFAQKIVSAIPGMKDYVEQADQMVEANERLEDSQREYAVNSAKREAEISELRAKSAESDKYTYKEREQFLQKALDLEKDELKEKKKIAVEEYNLAVKKIKNDKHVKVITQEVWDSLDESIKNHITELKVAMINADKEYSDGTRRIRSTMASFREQEENERKQQAKAAAQRAKERAKNELTAQQDLEDAFIKSIRDMYDREYAETAVAYQREIDALKRRLKEEENLTLKARLDIQRQITLKEADMAVQLSEMRERQEKETNQKIEDMRRKSLELERKLAASQNDLEMVMKIDLQLNELDGEALKQSLAAPLEEAKRIVESVTRDLNTLSEQDIAAKYGETFARRGISVAEGYHKALEELQDQYNAEMLKKQEIYDKEVLIIDKQTALERKRIEANYTRDVKNEEDRRLNIKRKHDEILRQIELGLSYDAYGRNEVEKTKILLAQSQERLRIAQEEAQRLKDLRLTKTDEQLTEMFGSVDEYNTKVAESELKVVEAENAVKAAIKDVDAALMEEKIQHLQTAASVMNSVNDILGSFQGLFETLAESDEKYSDFATAMALMQILVSTAVSIATAVQSAMVAASQTGLAAPFTAPAFIAEMIAIVVGAMASATTTLLKAKQAKQSAPKFSKGGLVGDKTTRRKDDTVDAKLSLGEYVIPSEVVKEKGVGFFDELIGRKKGLSFTLPHLKFADGGLVAALSTPNFQTNQMEFDYDAMKEVFSEAVSDIQPVVSVKEIASVQRRVEVKERLANQ